MSATKLLVFCIDALCSGDLAYMREMPHFAEILPQSAVVTHIEPAYPSMTYVCHTTILTGQNPAKHGIYHNERVRRGGHFNGDWFNMRSEVKVPTLLDVAKNRGLSTCSLSWPVSGGANWDMNMPMIVPYGYTGYQPAQFLENTATPNLMERYFWKYGRFQMGEARSLDNFTMALAPDILRDFGQPDVMLVKMCDLDGARHAHGVYSKEALEQLRRHDEEFGVLLESVRRYGDYDATNFVILGDHGQTDVEDVLHMNVLLEQNGFLRLNADGKLADYDALCHSSGMCGFIELREGADEALKTRVHNFLKDLKNDERIQMDYVFTPEEALEQYGLSGPFDFVVESKRALSFSEKLGGDELFGTTISGDHKVGSASHGGLPFKDETTCFIACGPSVKAGAQVQRRPMVDEAPTMARMLGFAMDGVDGTAIEELLR